jgi:hypothetical protein
MTGGRGTLGVAIDPWTSACFRMKQCNRSPEMGYALPPALRVTTLLQMWSSHSVRHSVREVWLATPCSRKNPTAGGSTYGTRHCDLR